MLREILRAHALTFAVAPLAFVLTTCQSNALPPLPEVVVVVDTDLPSPLVASRARVDVYADDGTWFDSVEVSRLSPLEWPMSFGVYSGDDSRVSHVWVRVRVYPDGRTRDYLGERPHRWDGPLVGGASQSAPLRLVKNGVDVTPVSEPDPLDTVDRLARVTLSPGSVARVGVVLRGACVGTSAVLADDPSRGPILGQAQTCLDSEKTLVPVEASVDTRPSARSLVGTWLATKCPAAEDPSSVAACMPGGATLVGTVAASANVSLASTPVRVFGVNTFWIDRREVSVGRFRTALATGFKPTKLPAPRDRPLVDTANGWCTWSAVEMGREDYAVTCLEWQTAREFCQFAGGDLPTEVQWEHAGTTAGRAEKVRFPWGNDIPTCARAVFGRSVVGGRTCQDQPAGVPSIAESDVDHTSLGVNGLAGGVTEWTLDRGVSYLDSCWSATGIVDPLCGDPAVITPTSTRALRGFSFATQTVADLGTRFFLSVNLVEGLLGFRCAYPSAPR